MSLIVCPECGKENVSSAAYSCPNCGYPISQYYTIKYDNEEDDINEELSSENQEPIVQQQEQSSFSNCPLPDSNKSGKTIRITICVVAIVLIWCAWFFSTRCASSGCMEHKASSSRLCSYHKSLLNSYSSSSSSSSYKSKYALVISDVNVHSNSVATYCTGTIKNNGSSTYEFIKLKGAFKDQNGNVIETGDTYGAGGEGLAPGESTSFIIYCSKNSEICSCDVSVYDFD